VGESAYSLVDPVEGRLTSPVVSPCLLRGHPLWRARLPPLYHFTQELPGEEPPPAAERLYSCRCGGEAHRLGGGRRRGNGLTAHTTARRWNCSPAGGCRCGEGPSHRRPPPSLYACTEGASGGGACVLVQEQQELEGGVKVISVNRCWEGFHVLALPTLLVVARAPL
jgi:hypothetical protein